MVESEAALASADRAIQLAAPRKYRLIQADALNLRARVYLERPNANPSQARDNAEAALQLAEFCEYAWAQRDALEILTKAYKLLGDENESLKYRSRHEDWNRRLTIPN